MLASDPHTNLLLQQPISEALLTAHYDLDVITTVQHPGWSRRLLAGPQKPDYLLLLTPENWPPENWPPETAAASRRLAAEFRQTVCFSLEPQALADQPEWVCITPDLQREARLVVEHLLALGHRRIAAFVDHVNQPELNTSCARSARFARDLLEVAGAEFVPFCAVDGHERLIELVRDRGVTAFWDLNDATAMTSLQHLYRAGLKVPEQVSVIGRHDTPWCRQAVPPLTSVSMNPQAISQAILDAVGGDHRQHYAIAPQLIVRDSTGPAWGGRS